MNTLKMRNKSARESLWMAVMEKRSKRLRPSLPRHAAQLSVSEENCSLSAYLETLLSVCIAITPTAWPPSAQRGLSPHHAPTDKPDRGDNQHCTEIPGVESRSRSRGLVIRCVARCPLNMHSAPGVAPYSAPCRLGLETLLPVGLRPNCPSHPPPSLKRFSSTTSRRI